MKNLFSFLKTTKKPAADAVPAAEESAAPLSPAPEITPPESSVPEASAHHAPAADDGYITWLRTRTLGGVEPNGRNDIYEAYSVYGADAEGRMTHRYYHRYPEYERAFGLSYDRPLTFDELNRQLLEELDRGGVTLGDYLSCIAAAERLASPDAPADTEPTYEFSEAEIDALTAFCQELDTLRDKQYLSKGNLFRCSGVSAIGDEELWLSFRKPLRHDALNSDILGISRTEIGGYDIGSLWILSIFNRLRERCERCRVILLKSEWNPDREPVILFAAEGIEQVGGALLVTVAHADTLSRFGAYSLNFMRR